jgi:hypothetical protein
MPSANITRMIINAIDVAAAVGITATTGADYRLTDTFGITYTGTPAHLALSALARPDLTSWPDHVDHDTRTSVRRAAHTFIDWFTSPHVDPGHADEFAALTPTRVCELVAYLTGADNPTDLNVVGPQSLHACTEHLLHHSVPNSDRPFPRLTDVARQSLGTVESQHRLQVTASAGGGTDEVRVMLDIEAGRRIFWEFTASIPIPVAELDVLLRDPDYLLGVYLSDHRELVDRYLTYRNAGSVDGIGVDATLAAPGASPTYTQTPTTIPMELFFVGADRNSALSGAAFTRREPAERAAAAGEQVYVAAVDVVVGYLRLEESRTSARG